MFIIPIGPLSLNGPLLMYLLYGLAGYFSVVWLTSRDPEKDRIRSLFFSGSVVWLLVWKGSLLVFDPASVIRYPASLLYFDGGPRGIWMAIFVSIGFLLVQWYRSKPKLRVSRVAEALFIYIMVGYTAYQLGFFVLGRPEFTAIGCSISIAALLLFLLGKGSRRGSPSRKRWAKQFVVLSGAMLLIWIAAAEQIGRMDELSRERASGVGASIGQRAPDVPLKTLDGAPASLSDYRGKVVFVNFWATWCPPCRVEMPSLQALHEAYGGEDVAVLAVNLTTKERDSGAAERFLSSNGLSVPALLDADGEALRSFRIRSYPTTFVIDREGVITDVHEGAIHYFVMEQSVTKLLEQEL